MNVNRRAPCAWHQMLADSAGATVYYSLMAGYSERALAAYGVTDAVLGVACACTKAALAA